MQREWLKSSLKKLSEKGFALRSEREFGRCIGAKQVEQCHSMPSEATFRALTGLLRQFQGEVRSTTLLRRLSDVCLYP
jgi:hypothetical protein